MTPSWSITCTMTPFDYRSESLCQDTLLVMQAYGVRAAAAKVAADETSDGWLERIDSLPQLSAQDLTRVHGQLIAMGYLKFEVSGRSLGLRYQISDRGRAAVDKTLSSAAGESSNVDPSEEFCGSAANSSEPSDLANAA